MVGNFISGPFLKDDFYAYCETKKAFDDKGKTNALSIEKYIDKCKKELGMSIRCIITDQAGQCAMAHRILRPRHPDIIFEFCWAHQFDLVCKKIVKQFCLKYEGFDSNLRRLIGKINGVEELKRRFFTLIERKFGKQLKRPLVTIADTRFNTYYLALSRILSYQQVIIEMSEEKDNF